MPNDNNIKIFRKNINGLNKRSIYYKLLKPILVNNYKTFYTNYLDPNNINEKIFNQVNMFYYDNDYTVTTINNIRKDLLLLIIDKWISCNYFNKYKEVYVLITNKFLNTINSLYNDIVIVLYSSFIDTINDLISGFVNKFFLLNYYDPSKAPFMSFYNSIIVYCVNNKDNISIYSNDNIVVDNINKKINKNISNVNDFIIEYNYYHNDYGGYSMFINKNMDRNITYSNALIENNNKNNSIYYHIPI